MFGYRQTADRFHLVPGLPKEINAVTARRQFILLPAAFAFAGSGSVVEAQSNEITVRAEDAYKLAGNCHGVAVGLTTAAANTIYIFFDAADPRNSELWLNSASLKSRFKMMWIPVGVARSMSFRQGATILGAADPLAAMNDNNARVLNRQGGIAVAENLTDSVLARIETNTAVFNKLGSTSLPLILYRHARSGKPFAVAKLTSAEKLAALIDR